MNEQMLWLGAITLLAATVNGALGYGFSSITVPLALLFLSNRVLNPALIIIEVPLNAYVLWVNRASLPAVWRRVSVEAGVKLGWERLVGDRGRSVSIEHYGASAPAETIYEHFGVTSGAVAGAARELLAER